MADYDATQTRATGELDLISWAYGSTSTSAGAATYANHGKGLYHLGTVGQVSPSAGMTIAYGAIPIGAAIDGAIVTSALIAGTIAVDAAHATLNRRDIVYYTIDGAVAIEKGTAAATPAATVPVGRNNIVLAEVYIAAADTTIDAGDITDMRQLVMSGTRYAFSDTDETVNNSAALQNDNTIFLSVQANEEWVVQTYFDITTGATPGFQCDWSVPAGASYRMWFKSGDGSGASTGQYTAQGNSTIAFNRANSVGPTWITTLILIGATAGTANFRWAQQTADASNTTVDNKTMTAYRVQ